MLVASDTAPVRELVRDGHNDHLVDFFDIDALAARVLQVLDAPNAQLALRTAARRTAQDYGLQQGLQSYRALLAANA